ncbi:MAG: antibiotic biosynthesis monooxygenase [Myxococcales bacterium]|nr:antibiotic biosynthesis monooxygenase [Myxococcales bacterium]
MNIATTPKPPYYAVIFTATQTDDLDGYAKVSERMVLLAKQQIGFLGWESARDEIGISVSYWSDLQAIKAWKQQSEHLEAQATGKARWYRNYTVRIAKVEKAYSL